MSAEHLQHATQGDQVCFGEDSHGSALQGPLSSSNNCFDGAGDAIHETVARAVVSLAASTAVDRVLIYGGIKWKRREGQGC